MALAALEALAKRESGDLEILHRASVMLLNMGHVDRALSYARQVVAIEPKAHLAHLLLLADAARKNKLHVAKDEVAALTDDGLGPFLKPFLAAWLKAEKKDYAGARVALEPAGKMGSIDKLYHLHAGMLAELAGDAKAARQHFTKLMALGMDGRAASIIAGFYERQKDEKVKTSLMLAVRQSGLEMMDGVAPRVEGLAAGMADTMIGMATLLQGEGVPEVALPYAQLAAAADPSSASAHLLVGDLLTVNGQNAAAKAAYGKLLDDPSASFLARMRSAGVAARMGEDGEAVQIMESLTRDYPARGEAWAQLGDVRAVAKAWPEAEAAYVKAAKLVRVGGDDLLLMRLQSGVGKARLAMGDRAGAAEAFEAAVAANGDQAELLNALGYLYAEEGRNLDRAGELLTRAMELRPEEGAIVDSLGWVRFRQGNMAEAVRLLELAAQLAPYNAVINDHLGDAYWSAGRRVEARFQWQRALRYNISASTDEPLSIEALEAKLATGLPKTQTAEVK